MVGVVGSSPIAPTNPFALFPVARVNLGHKYQFII
jgi:hypothetical protein